MYITLNICPSTQLFNFCPAGGFHGNNPFCLGEDEEVEIEVQENFLSFGADLVAEQLTYMDAVRVHILIYNITHR